MNFEDNIFNFWDPTPVELVMPFSSGLCDINIITLVLPPFLGTAPWSFMLIWLALHGYATFEMDALP